MQAALEALPWVGKAEVSFKEKRVTVTVDSKKADAKPLIDISGGKNTALRTAFNDNPKDVRVVVILSPS